MKKRILALLLTLALLLVGMVFAVSASETDDGDSGSSTPATFNINEFDCPCAACVAGTTPTWESLPANSTSKVSLTASKHYYCEDETFALKQVFELGNNSTKPSVECVLVLNGTALTAEKARTFSTIYANTKWHIVGTNGASITTADYTGQGALAQVGAYGSPSLHLYGDLSIRVDDVSGKTTTKGGLFKVASGGTLQIHKYGKDEGLVSDADPVLYGCAAGTTSKEGGGAIYVQAGTFTMDAGEINGGTTSYYGGTILQEGGTININSGTVNGGTANIGGTICITGGTLNIKGGQVNGGTASNGATICVVGGTTNISAGEVKGGTASNRGGNFYLYGGKLNITGANAVVSNGTASSQGHLGYMEAGTVNVSAGTLVNTKTDKCGIRVAKGKFILQGTAIYKAAQVNRGAFDLIATSASEAALILAGSAKITNTAGEFSKVNTILMQQSEGNYGKLYVDNSFAGWAAFDCSGDAGYVESWGGYVGGVPGSDNAVTYYVASGTLKSDNTFEVGGDLTGDCRLHYKLDYSSSGSERCKVFGEDGKLFLARATLLNADSTTNPDGGWAASIGDACTMTTENGEDHNIRLISSHAAEVPAGVDAIVDLNGVSITGVTIGDGASLSIWDQDASLASASGGTVTGTGYEPYYVRPNGDIYVMNGGKCYRVAHEISTVNLRPSEDSASLYYTATFNMNSGVNGAIAARGVAVTLNSAATATNEQQLGESFLYTQNVNSNNDYTSALVNGIVKKEGIGAAENGNRAVVNIYAYAYIQLTTGEVILSECVDWSLLDTVNKVAAMYNTDLTVEQKASFDSLYTWCTNVEKVELPAGKAWVEKAQATA